MTNNLIGDKQKLRVGYLGAQNVAGLTRSRRGGIAIAAGSAGSAQATASIAALPVEWRSASISAGCTAIQRNPISRNGIGVRPEEVHDSTTTAGTAGFIDGTAIIGVAALASPDFDTARSRNAYVPLSCNHNKTAPAATGARKGHSRGWWRNVVFAIAAVREDLAAWTKDYTALAQNDQRPTAITAFYLVFTCAGGRGKGAWA